MKALSLFLLAGLSGCTAPNPKSCADDFCHDPALPFCDADGSISGTPNTCIAVECTPNEFASCRGDEVLTCNAAGSDYDVTSCEFGCNEAAKGCNACVPGSDDCKPHIIPAHMPDACYAPATQPALIVSASTTIDTDDDSSCTGGVIIQIGDVPDICVVRHESIVIEAGATVKAQGTRALAFIADDAMTIEGILDVSADLTDVITNGPGGGVVTSGMAGTGYAGAGGAGFKTAGGDGGNDAGDGGADNGGAAAMNPANLLELVGGRRSEVTANMPAGGAGGAVAVVSCRGTVSVPGLIDAGGGGGYAGFFSGGLWLPGGGGSGGNIVLQGMNVAVEGEIFANGGGGGGGSHDEFGESGADGSRSATVSAQGGQPPINSGGGAGGAGGRVGTSPTVGKKRTMSETYISSGAGGGSTGFIQTYTPEGVTPMLNARAVSPAFETNRSIETR